MRKMWERSFFGAFGDERALRCAAFAYRYRQFCAAAWTHPFIVGDVFILIYTRENMAAFPIYADKFTFHSGISP
jgi:hypothetical protein